MSVFDPDEDEWGAQRRDLHRLDEILGAPAADNAARYADLDDAGRAEVLEILGRLNTGTDPEVIEARQKVLADYALMEATLLEILDKGQPRYRNGKVLVDKETGKPLRNRNIDRQARAQLREVRRARAQVLGEPSPDRDG